MKDGYFESRAEQVETEDLRDLLTLLANPPKTARTQRKRALIILRRAAFSGACGERDRTLEILKNTRGDSGRVRRKIGTYQRNKEY